MPEKFSQLNIILAALLTFTVLCNAVMMILAPADTVKGKTKTVRIVLFSVNCITVLHGILFMIMKLLMMSDSASFKVNEDFTFFSGGYKYTVPVISSAFSDMDMYAFFGMLGSFSLCFAFAGIAVQIILWVSGRRKPSGRKKTDKPHVASVPESTPEQKNAAQSLPENEKLRIRRLGNKIILKSDAESAYNCYMKEKGTR